VSERAGAKAGGSNPFANMNSFACRGGERHPGHREGGALRGASSERRPRSVRRVSWVSSRGIAAPMTTDVRRSPRRGTSSACATTRMHSMTGARDRCLHTEDASFTRSGDPCASILTMHSGESSDGGADESASRLGKPGEPGGTNTGVGFSGRSAARRVSPLPQGRRRGTSEKEEGRGLRPCENRRARVWLPARRIVSCRSR
jgi:hypothetical protein